MDCTLKLWDKPKAFFSFSYRVLYHNSDKTHSSAFHALDFPMRHCVSYSAVAVIKHHDDQKQLMEERVYWLTVPGDWESVTAGRRDSEWQAQQQKWGAERSHREKDYEMKHSNPTLSDVSDVLLPARSHLLNLPQRSLQLGSSVQIPSLHSTFSFRSLQPSVPVPDRFVCHMQYA